MNETLTFDQLLKQNYGLLCAVAMRFVDRTVAEDITQDVILKFWENRHRYAAHVESIERFLYVMVRNRTLNYMRDHKRPILRLDSVNLSNTEDPVIFGKLVEEDVNQIVVEALHKLPTQSSEVMRLVLSGYDNHEIASLLGISVNTVKTLKYGAIKRMKILCADLKVESLV